MKNLSKAGKIQITIGIALFSYFSIRIIVFILFKQ